jgi:hypothetical protein
MIAAMICSLIGVDRSAILDNYEAGVRAFNVWKLANPFREPPETEVDQYLLAAGVTAGQLTRISARLLDA